MSTKHERTKQNWEDIATLDPYWTILSDEKRKYGKWDEDEFFATGEEEVRKVMDRITELDLSPGHGHLLDYGCGVGRTTRAFASHFDECLGLDIAESMITLAKEQNASLTNVQFMTTLETMLESLPDGRFDMVYCNIVLQHLPLNVDIRPYIAHFVRLLASDGVLCFQLPTALPWFIRLQPRRRVYQSLVSLGLSPAVLYTKLGLHPISTRSMPQATVLECVQTCGGKIVHVDGMTDPNFHFPSAFYWVTK